MKRPFLRLAPGSPKKLLRSWPLTGLGLLFLFVLIRTAWTCDDAFISHACAANLAEGKGLTFQPWERVQAFSNPLWTLLMAGAYALTHEVWMTGMVLNMALSLAVLFLLIPSKPGNRLFHFLAGALILVSSAYVDFSTSGLENALSHLLVLLFAQVFLTRRRDAGWLRNLTGIAAFCMLTRPDLAFLVAPAILYALLSAEKKGRWTALFIGLLPILLWEAFSLTYYGFLLPNTWYAKLGVGEGRLFLMGKGLHYLWNALKHDPVTVLVIAGGIVSVLKGRDRKKMLLMAGAMLYLLAVVSAGGDFMRGRMLTVPFVLALFLVLRCPLPPWAPLPVLALLIGGLFRADCPLYSGPDYHIGRTEEPWLLYSDNITDERAMYWARTGWLADHGQDQHPMRELEQEAQRNRAQDAWKSPPNEVQIVGSIGMRGYRAVPGLYLLDEAALADPLLARLPALDTRWWRAGHRPRVLPDGYVAHLYHADAPLTDPRLDAYLDKLGLVTRGPAWSGERWEAILGFLLGRYTELVDRERYREGLRVVPLDHWTLPEDGPIEAGAWRPIQLAFSQPQTATEITFEAQAGEIMELGFYLNGQLVREEQAEPSAPGTSPATYEFRLASPLTFDAVRLRGAIFHRDLVLHGVQKTDPS